MIQSSQAVLQKLEQESSLRDRVRTSLLEWAIHALKPLDQTPAAHHRLLLRELESLCHGDIDRLMIQMPPGSAKSTYASTLFPAWWFSQHPGSSIIATSNTAALAQYFGKRVRDLIATEQPRLGYELMRGERAASHWRLSNGGQYFSSGTRGSIVGRRADLVIVDDPIGNQAQADRADDRDRIWEWFRSDLTTRLKPNGRIIIIMNRWHEDDLSGRASLQLEEGWRILKLPALAEQNDPLGRMAGEPLWPELEDVQALTRKRSSLGERAWSALFQQAPRPLEGSLFKVAHLLPIDYSTESAGTTIRAWDLAATPPDSRKDPDWTVGLKLRVDQPGHFQVLDVIRLRGSARQVEQTILSTASLDGRDVHIGLPEDPGQAGKSQVAYYTGMLAGYHVITSRESGSKYTRAQPVASQVEAGNITLACAEWNHAFIDELREFPNGSKDDQVDALVRAFTALIDLSPPTRKINIPYISR